MLVFRCICEIMSGLENEQKCEYVSIGEYFSNLKDFFKGEEPKNIRIENGTAILTILTLTPQKTLLRWLYERVSLIANTHTEYSHLNTQEG